MLYSYCDSIIKNKYIPPDFLPEGQLRVNTAIGLFALEIFEQGFLTELYILTEYITVKRNDFPCIATNDFYCTTLFGIFSQYLCQNSHFNGNQIA